jgi:hypothetical protein
MKNMILIALALGLPTISFCSELPRPVHSPRTPWIYPQPEGGEDDVIYEVKENKTPSDGEGTVQTPLSRKRGKRVRSSSENSLMQARTTQKQEWRNRLQQALANRGG